MLTTQSEDSDQEAEEVKKCVKRKTKFFSVLNVAKLIFTPGGGQPI